MGFETSGRLHAVSETKQVTERFRKREFVVELADNPRFPQFVQKIIPAGLSHPQLPQRMPQQ